MERFFVSLKESSSLEPSACRNQSRPPHRMNSGAMRGFIAQRRLQ